ncbi:DMT family transporter [Caldinitratiruptor microaerophilus]|uniref:EamA family transporter n=1 Tax=Caldinitratiruptor microaerophilus TaxID=671077 RepID=A0AA35CMR9_9FIRM|nr:DMT family transporter [Caldinitratiruptor microaerophilus]BDG60221.1 EamA family transporter [Caldinitratiruptor microaerophilus]
MRRWKGYALVLLAAVLWGSLGIVGRRLYAGGLSPEVAVTYRSLGTAVFLGAYLGLVRPALLAVRSRDLPFLALYGLVSVGLYNLLYFTAIRLIPVATAAVLLYTAPLFVAILGRVLFDEPLTPAKWVLLLVTLVGTALAAGAYDLTQVRLNATGLLAGLGAGFTYGLYSIFGKYGLGRYSPWTLVLYTQIAGTAVVAPLAGAAALAAPLRRPDLWPALAYMILGPTLFAYAAYLGGLREIESSHASITATVEPVVAAILGAAVLGEVLAWPQVLGIALVLGGVALLQVRTSGGPPPGTPSAVRRAAGSPL